MRRGDQNGRMVVAGVVIADTHQVGVCVGASRAVDGRGRRRRAGPRHGLHRRLSSIDARTHESLFWGMVVLVERETALGMREYAKDVRFWQSRKRRYATFPEKRNEIRPKRPRVCCHRFR